jgi:hypothetical protein
MKTLSTTILLLLFGYCKAQFPFEIYPIIKYDRFELVHRQYPIDSSFYATANIFEKNNNNLIRIEFREKFENDSSNIFIFRNNLLVQKIIEPEGFCKFIMPDSIYIGDINNDGLLDMKLFCFNTGSGLAAFLIRKIYLIGRFDSKFDKYSFMDFSDEIERDFNGDKNFEIIALDHIGYENHSYWIYDLFNFRDRQFINVSKEFDYPIMIQHLFRINYSITNNISREKMKEFSKIKPDWFDERK